MYGKLLEIATLWVEYGCKTNLLLLTGSNQTFMTSLHTLPHHG